MHTQPTKGVVPTFMHHACGKTWGLSFFTGEKGRRIRELTSVVQKRFNFPAESVELYAEKVADRGLCAVAQAESLRYKLLGGLAVRRCVFALVEQMNETCRTCPSGCMGGFYLNSAQFGHHE